MGMDIYGRKPKNKGGKYIRYSGGWWNPVANYILDNVPKEITKKCKYWYSNSYDGLDAAHSSLVADFLETQMKDGTAAKYIEQRNSYIKSLPKKKRKNYSTLEIGDIERVLEFLRGCGGFTIT